MLEFDTWDGFVSMLVVRVINLDDVVGWDVLRLFVCWTHFWFKFAEEMQKLTSNRLKNFFHSPLNQNLSHKNLHKSINRLLTSRLPIRSRVKYFSTLTRAKSGFPLVWAKWFKSDYGEEFKKHLKHIKLAINILIALVERREVEAMKSSFACCN